MERIIFVKTHFISPSTRYHLYDYDVGNDDDHDRVIKLRK